MKRILTLTATALLAGAGAVSAMSVPSNVEISEIRGYAPNADLSGLSAGQVAALQAIIHGNDSEGRAGREVRNYLSKLN